jgi:hypothetical protein
MKKLPFQKSIRVSNPQKLRTFLVIYNQEIEFIFMYATLYRCTIKSIPSVLFSHLRVFYRYSSFIRIHLKHPLIKIEKNFTKVLKNQYIYVLIVLLQKAVGGATVFEASMDQSSLKTIQRVCGLCFTIDHYKITKVFPLDADSVINLFFKKSSFK